MGLPVKSPVVSTDPAIGLEGRVFDKSADNAFLELHFSNANFSLTDL